MAETRRTLPEWRDHYWGEAQARDDPVAHLRRRRAAFAVEGAVSWLRPFSVMLYGGGLIGGAALGFFVVMIAHVVLDLGLGVEIGANGLVGFRTTAETLYSVSLMAMMLGGAGLGLRHVLRKEGQMRARELEERRARAELLERLEEKARAEQARHQALAQDRQGQLSLAADGSDQGQLSLAPGEEGALSEAPAQEEEK